MSPTVRLRSSSAVITRALYSWPSVSNNTTASSTVMSSPERARSNTAAVSGLSAPITDSRFLAPFWPDCSDCAGISLHSPCDVTL